MPTWAMISVIAGVIAGWSVIGAWRMKHRAPALPLIMTAAPCDLIRRGALI